MKRIFTLIVSVIISLVASAQSAGRHSFNDGWCFKLGDDEKFSSEKFDDASWRHLNLPHDWAIEGDFNEKNPSGTGGGALPGGVGWYRKTFELNDKESKGKRVRVDFDGVYMNATVFVNGHQLGTRPYGYISFGYDITPYLKGGKNTIAVRVDNKEQPNSRWYSGCGIYRNVWITYTSDVHVAHDGVFIRGEYSTDSKAFVKVDAEIENSGSGTKKVKVMHELRDANGFPVATSEKVELKIPSGKKAIDRQALVVLNPHYWDVNDPALYTLITKVYETSNGTVVDTYKSRTGIRRIEFSDKGFKLNDKKIQIQGVCNHHDLGCLGAAVNTSALRRQLKLLKDIGINGIRCSHNPPAPELLDLCDEMGFIVMDEAFDMWRKKKTSHDYARYFNEWHEHDLRDLIVRDRNHPSICIWSIGNEVLEQWSDANADTLSLEEANMILNFGHSPDQLSTTDGEMSVNSLLTKKLADFVRKIDDSRPVTAGCNEPSMGNHLFASGALDMIGFNYHNQNIPDVPNNFPDKPFIITESVSALQTRGYYEQSDKEIVCPERWDKPYVNPTFSCSSYDHCHAPWSNTHEENLLVLKNNPWVAGQYIWTGFDYIGEPTPYGWPARSSYFGIIDLAGFPKDVYYLYQAELTDNTVLHLLPHWNFGDNAQSGNGLAESKLTADGMVDVWAYYNKADEVELFINGISQGRSRKTSDRLHAQWHVKYAPGELKAVSYKDAQVVAKTIVRTAGAPAKLRLTADRDLIAPNGKDLSFITVEVLDKDNNLCPNANNLVNFQVEGNCTIAGVDNGSPISLERFKDNKRKAFYGKCLVVLQNNGTKGGAHLKATSEGLEAAEIDVISR